MEIKKCKCGRDFPQFRTTDTKCYKCKMDRQRAKLKEKKKITLPSVIKSMVRFRYHRDKKMEAWHDSGRRRAGGKCEVCGRPFPKDELCGDHILTRGAFPEFKYDLDNQVIVCLEDHEKRNRGQIDPKTHPVYKPRYDIMMSKVANAKR